MIDRATVLLSGGHRPDLPPTLSGAVRNGDFVLISARTSTDLDSGTLAQFQTPEPNPDRLASCSRQFIYGSHLPAVTTVHAAPFHPSALEATAMNVRAPSHADYRIKLNAETLVAAQLVG